MTLKVNDLLIVTEKNGHKFTLLIPKRLPTVTRKKKDKEDMYLKTIN